MQIIGIGTDLIDIRRIEKCVKKYDIQFLKKIFTKVEIEIIKKKQNCCNHIAKRWAAKEACIKALQGQVNWHEIEIKNLANGQPIINLANKKHQKLTTHLSLTDEYPYASANIIIIKLNNFN